MSSLRQLRREAGISQAELARRSGLRQATISAIENRRSHPHRATVEAIARALDVDVTVVEAMKVGTTGNSFAGTVERAGRDWPFLAGIDVDLRQGLVKELIAGWTHSSTAIEGNTITAGDTLFVLSEGLTVSGKSLREHEEIHGHAQAIGLLSSWIAGGNPARIGYLHELHRAVQTGVVMDVFAPIGRWKVEANGTTAITTSGEQRWHDYARPDDVPALVDTWLKDFDRVCRQLRSLARGGGDPSGDTDTAERLVSVYTDVHLGFTSIHPYADGNGRLARLLANIPLLRVGVPPLLVDVAQRREYLALLGDYSLAQGRPTPGKALVLPGKERDALAAFFTGQWRSTWDLVAGYRERQKERAEH